VSLSRRHFWSEIEIVFKKASKCKKKQIQLDFKLKTPRVSHVFLVAYLLSSVAEVAEPDRSFLFWLKSILSVGRLQQDLALSLFWTVIVF
jgi:hypothetical protein